MKKLNSIKWFTLGVMVTILMSALVIPATAANRQKQATLYYQDTKITLNGETVIPKDVNGNVIEPFVIDGTTYLPVRGIADALGVKVEWSAATNTVILETNRSIDHVPQFRTSAININLYEVWYENGKLHARAFITNGFNSTASNINVKDLKISNSDGIIAEGSFGILKNATNATIAPNGYITWVFTFSGDALKVQNADLTGHLRAESTIEYKY